MNVANGDVRGRVVDNSTGQPVVNALIVQTIGRGGFWSTPSTYDLGSTLSKADGSFLIPAAPQCLLNISDSGDRPLLGIFAEGYGTTWFARNGSPFSDIEIRLTKLPLGKTLYDPCKPVPYTGQTCQRIREHLNLGGKWPVIGGLPLTRRVDNGTRETPYGRNWCRRLCDSASWITRIGSFLGISSSSKWRPLANSGSLEPWFWHHC